MTNKDKLVEVIKRYGVVWAPEGEEFTLASGAKSKFYVDFSKVIMVPEAAKIIAEAVIGQLPEVVDAIGGPMSGADPIVGAVLSQIGAAGPLRGFVIRKEPKGRGPGAGEMHEGYLNLAMEVVLVEDVTTSGGSVLKAIKVVEERGANVKKVITLLDRQAGAGEKLAGYDFVALTTLQDLGL